MSNGHDVATPVPSFKIVILGLDRNRISIFELLAKAVEAEGGEER